MQTLDLLLNVWRDEMRRKLLAVAHKYGGVDNPRSVTSESFDWSNPIVAAEIREHLLREIGEWLTAPQNNGNPAHTEPKELVDIGNCAFLLWAMRTRDKVTNHE